MRTVCRLCPHHCVLEEGQTGRCRGRENRGGSVVCANYGRLTSVAVDPIEKKPFRRFHPGRYILSVGSYGCNLRCPFCQNHEISMAGAEIPAEQVSPERLVELAMRLTHTAAGNIGVAFTYNEPLISYEYVRDAARLLRKQGLCTVLVTNGMIEAEPLQQLLPRPPLKQQQQPLLLVLQLLAQQKIKKVITKARIVKNNPCPFN